MTPEASAYLGKSKQCLGYARTNLAAALSNDAGRNAYLAMFHAAQALVYERTGKAAKTHQGVHAEFNRITKAVSFDRELRRSLPRIYNLKAVADYETGPDAVIPLERASSAVDMWVMHGRNDVAWYSNYLTKAAEYSDDGTVWRAGYGPRLRNWNGTDQFAEVRKRPC